jgi:hypothetical protein
MKKKTFIFLILFCVLAPSLIFGAYQFGVNNGYDRLISRPSDGSVYRNGYQTGYGDGLKAAQSGSTPLPTATP